MNFNFIQILSLLLFICSLVSLLSYYCFYLSVINYLLLITYYHLFFAIYYYLIWLDLSTYFVNKTYWINKYYYYLIAVKCQFFELRYILKVDTCKNKRGRVAGKYYEVNEILTSYLKVLQDVYSKFNLRGNQEPFLFYSSLKINFC